MKRHKIFRFFSFILVLLCSFFIVGCKEDIKDSEDSNKPNNPDIENPEKPEDDEYIPPFDNDLKVYFINVGQADCQLCMLPNGMNVLIDAGLDHATCFCDNDFPSWENIMTIFNLEHIETIDYFIITHYHSDHYKFAERIIENYDVKNMVLSGSTSTQYSYRNLLQTIKRYKVNTIIAEVGMKLIDEEYITLQVVATQKINNPSDANICSVCTKLTYNKNSILSMGDAGTTGKDGYSNGESIAMHSGIDLQSDILKVGHHGSSKSSGRNFLSKVKPQYAVMTTAKFSTTHHPHGAAIDRIKRHTDKIYQTKDDGTILAISNGKDIIFKTHIGE